MRIRSVLLAVLAVVVLAVPATAEIYTLQLTNGSQFQSRYRPVEASWDADTILVLTDVGNWIAVPRADVVSVTTETEREGFGKVIDTHTIAIGWAANDAPEEVAEADLDPMSRLLNFLAAEQANQPNYSVTQFAEPSEAGMGGLPVSGLTAPNGGVNNVFGGGNTAFPVRSGGNDSSEPSVVDN